MSTKHWSWIPKTSYSAKSSSPKFSVGYSPSQARILVILISSVTHAMFFVMMGSKSGYWTCFSAYTVAAFSRGLLTGMASSCFHFFPKSFDFVIASLNEYFALGYPQSLGYAFGMWSMSFISVITFNFTFFVCRSGRRRVSIDMSDRHFERHSLGQILPWFSHFVGLEYGLSGTHL